MKTTPTITLELPYVPLDEGMRYLATWRVATLHDHSLAVRFPVHEHILTHRPLETLKRGEWAEVFLEGQNVGAWRVLARRDGVVYLTQPNFQRVLEGCLG